MISNWRKSFGLHDLYNDISALSGLIFNYSICVWVILAEADSDEWEDSGRKIVGGAGWEADGRRGTRETCRKEDRRQDKSGRRQREAGKERGSRGTGEPADSWGEGEATALYKGWEEDGRGGEDVKWESTARRRRERREGCKMGRRREYRGMVNEHLKLKFLLIISSKEPYWPDVCHVKKPLEQIYVDRHVISQCNK